MVSFAVEFGIRVRGGGVGAPFLDCSVGFDVDDISNSI